MKYLSVCSGMEAASVAWHPLGWTPVGFSEIEPFPCAILKHRFPNTPNYGDLTQYQQWPLSTGDVDLIAGGPPCQAFSVAGLRRGLADPRGNLTLTYLGLVDKLQPRWVVYENVPGLLSVDGGTAFGSFLGGLAELGYSAAWRVLDAQYVGSCRLHPHERGQSAVPQRRRRVFVVAVRGAGNWQLAAEVLSIAEGMRGNTPSRRKKGQGPAAGAEGGVGADSTVGTLCARDYKGADNIYVEEGKAVLHPCPDHDSVGTLCARDFKGVGNQFVQEGKCIPCKPIAFKVRGGGNYSGTKGGEVKPDEKGGTGYLGYEDKTFTVATTQDQWVAAPIPIQDGREMDKKQNGLGIANPGDPSYTIDTTGAQAAAIPYRKSKRAQSTTDDESWVPAEQSNTLNNFDLGDTRTTHAVVGPLCCNTGPNGNDAGNFACNQGVDAGHIIPVHCSKVATTVTSSGPPYSRTGNERVEAEALVAFQPGNLRRQGGADPSTEIFPTLKCDAGDQSPHVAYPVVPLDGMNLLSRLGPCGEEHSTQNFNPGDPQFTLKKGGHQHGVLTPMAVRRLTPVETERLQGFPDNWSRIPWKGKPETECPDGPRYKACGNSMAVPVMAFIGRRIAEVDAKYFPHA